MGGCLSAGKRVTATGDTRFGNVDIDVLLAQENIFHLTDESVGGL